MSAPFDRAEAYRAAGWSGTLAFEPQKKFPPPTGFTGHDGRWPSPADLARWRAEGRTNIALRLPHGVIGLDVDAYDGKPGRESLAKLEAAHGSLPATWTSTSRTDGVSGIRLFRVPHTVRDWPTDAEDAIEIIRYAHRYAMVGPSVHPENRTYRWVRPDGSDADEGEVPSPGDLAELPAAWLNALAGEPSTNGDRRPKGTRVRSREADAKARAWLRSLPRGEPCRYVGRLIAESREAIRTGQGSRYDRTRDIVGELLRGGEVGHLGVRRVLVDLRSEYVSAVAEKRGGRAVAEGEYDRFTLAGATKILASPGARAGSGCDCPEAMATVTPAADPAPANEVTLTDTGNSTRFVRLHGGRLHYIAKWDKWLCWDGSVWQIDDAAVRVRELAKDVGREIIRESADSEDKKVARFGFDSLSSGRIGSMVNLARGIEGVLLDHSRLDTDGNLLGVLNGTVDLRTGELRDADPANLMSMQAPVEYDPGADAPRWRQALEEWFPDPEVRAYVQRVVGATIVGEQRDHVLIIHFGGGSNGKGTFTRAIQHALGPYAVEVHLSLLVETRHAEHDTVKADLFRARLAIAVETERRVRLAEASVKNISGGDRIRARRMREDYWSFDPSHTLWLQTNHLPEISGRDEGIWRRIRVVKWVSKFDQQRQDRGLDTKLRAEAAGILAWAVRGALAWQSDGLAEPEAVLRDTLEYRRSEDVLTRFADDVGLRFGRGLSITAADAQKLLKEWAEAEGLDKPPTKELAGWLKERGARQKSPRVTSQDGTTKQVKTWSRAGVVTGVTDYPGSSLTRARKDTNPDGASHASQEDDEEAELELEYERLRAQEDAA